METASHLRIRGRGGLHLDSRPRSRNRQWNAAEGSSRSGSSTPNHIDGERWERGGHRGGGRGLRGRGRGAPKFGNVSLRVPPPKQLEPVIHEHDEIMQDGEDYEDEEEEEHEEFEEPVVLQASSINEPVFESDVERDKFFQELTKAREVERKKAIAEGKMDDPNVPKRLEDAITMVGTCMDMCPRYERYRREREGNLYQLEMIPGTRRIDHKRAVKMYERAAGDKTLPSDLRPPPVLKRTLNYLFHELLPEKGLVATYHYIRDRSRAVRTDFTMQHETGPIAIECHDRCARFHILCLHLAPSVPDYSAALEEQQLMNTLQSLKEFYEDQRGRYQSPTELEMRVYHRLIHIRDQKERHEDIPEHISNHPVFKLTTDFRLHVQKKSAPITKKSQLVVDTEGMEIFSRLAAVLREQGNMVMIYLVACILESLFGKDTIEDIEQLRGQMSIPDVIDGISTGIDYVQGEEHREVQHVDDEMQDELGDREEEEYEEEEYEHEEGKYEVQEEETTAPAPTQSQPSATLWSSSAFGQTGGMSAPPPTTAAPTSVFATLKTAPNPFGSTSVFGTPAFTTSSFPSAPKSMFGQISSSSAPATTSATGSVPVASAATSTPAPSTVAAPTPISATNGNLLQSSFSSSNLFGPKAVSNSIPSIPNFFSSTVTSTPPTRDASPLANDGAAPSAPLTSNAPPPFFKPLPTFSLPSATKTPSLNPQAPSFRPSFTPPTTLTPPPAPLVNGVHKDIPTINDTSSTSPMPLFSAPPLLNKSLSSNSPSLNRTSATPPLKIDTTPVSFNATPPPPGSPAIPPPLAKVQPISLPSTPIDSRPSLNLKLNLRNLDTSSPGLSRTNTEVLSPLVLASPSTSSMSVNNFTPSSTPLFKRLKSYASIPSLLNASGKTGDFSDLPETAQMQLNEKAKAFEQKSFVVKECFQQWTKKATDRAAWIEACRHSDAYRQKVQRQRLSMSRGATPDKKRRISTGPFAAGDSPVKKRARKRISNYQPPLTDEQLAQRFKENHEDHERRWAQGSFLQVFKTHLKGKLKAIPSPWTLWLSMNPESDATAIWLERKFDVPESGQWVSETVFSMSISSSMAASIDGYPGIIVFECTPIEGVVDDLEKKYRILDDCSRLRDIIKALPTKRHFVPSLLVFSWTEGEQAYPASDFFDMIKKLVCDSVLEGYHVLPITAATKDLDSKLGEALKSMTLDTEGKLVRSLTSHGLFKNFEPDFTVFLTEWIDNCLVNDRFNWSICDQLIQSSIALLNKIAKIILQLLGASVQDVLLPFDSEKVDGSESAYEASATWLSRSDATGDTEHIAIDLKAHNDIGQDFPARTFIEHLAVLAQARIQQRIGKDRKIMYHIPTSEIQPSLEAFKAAIQPHQMKLGQILNFSTRRSPKRRGMSVNTEQSSPDAKRIRLSASVASTVVSRTPPSSPLPNGRHTPSPTNSTVSLATTAEAPVVTVAMLRALTRDMKKRYAAVSR